MRKILAQLRYGEPRAFAAVVAELRRNGGNVELTARNLGVSDSGLRRAIVRTERGRRIAKQEFLGRANVRAYCVARGDA